MKKALLLCLLAFGMNATVNAQCPINDILTTRDPQTITSLIENNTDCIKQALTQNPEYENFKMYLDYIYNTSQAWVYHAYPEKEKQFAEFYNTWGKDYPTMRSPLPESPEFYKAMNAIVATDPAFFEQKKVTKIPLKYMHWLYVKHMNQKYGEQAVLNLTNAAAKIANQQSTLKYSAFAGH
jgi:hypothetical protein